MERFVKYIKVNAPDWGLQLSLIALRDSPVLCSLDFPINPDDAIAEVSNSLFAIASALTKPYFVSELDNLDCWGIADRMTPGFDWAQFIDLANAKDEWSIYIPGFSLDMSIEVPDTLDLIDTLELQPDVVAVSALKKCEVAKLLSRQGYSASPLNVRRVEDALMNGWRDYSPTHFLEDEVTRTILSMPEALESDGLYHAGGY